MQGRLSRIAFKFLQVGISTSCAGMQGVTMGSKRRVAVKPGESAASLIKPSLESWRGMYLLNYHVKL